MLIKIVELGCSLNARGKYSLSYKVGKVTTSLPGTMGIFCHNYFGQILNYPKAYIDLKEVTIYEVGGIGELPNKNKMISSLLNEVSLDKFYREITFLGRAEYQIFMEDSSVKLYKSVKVLRKVNKGDLKFLGT